MIVNKENITTSFNPIYINHELNTLNLNQYGLFDSIDENTETVAYPIQNEYLDLIKENELDIEGITFYFSDLTWDFSKLKPKHLTNIDSVNYKFNFKSLNDTNDYYMTLEKLFVLNEILINSIHSGAIYRKHDIIQSFEKFLYNKSVYRLDNLPINYVIEFFNSLNIIQRTKEKYKTAIKQFLQFYEICTNSFLDVNIYEYLNKVDKNKLSIEQRDNKIPLLPSSFMNSFTQLLLDDINKKSTSKEDIVKLGLLYIDTQTGLRTYEIMMIPYDCIRKNMVNGIEAKHMVYYSTKSLYNSNKFQKCKTILNKETEKIIHIIQNIVPKGSDKLCGDITATTLKDFLYDYCYKNAEILDLITDKPDDRFAGKPIPFGDKIINRPIIKQFRVYFTTEMRRRGYSAMMVSKLLNHHDEKMFDYYNRGIVEAEKQSQEFKADIIKEVIQQNTRILGPKGNLYMKRINSFIKNRDINVKDDLEAIIEDVNNNVPIRQKAGGCCIKPNPNRLCEHDAPTDDYLCAYGLCQNQCHFYFNCNYYYDQFNESKKIYKYNLDNGYERQAEKELFKIQRNIDDRLLPELDDLKQVIKEKGKDKVIEEHPSIKDIVNDLDVIYEEVIIWKNK